MWIYPKVLLSKSNPALIELYIILPDVDEASPDIKTISSLAKTLVNCEDSDKLSHVIASSDLNKFPGIPFKESEYEL